MNCQFGNNNCTKDGMSLFSSYRFINCYTFKNRATNFVPKGVENGLSLILKGHDIKLHFQYNFFSNIEKTESIRVVIHEPYTIPNVVDDAIEISPGRSTSLGISQVNIQRLKTPGSKCSEFQSQINGKKILHNLNMCVQNCTISYIMDKCGCITIQAPVAVHTIENIHHSRYCLYMDMSDVQGSLDRALCEFLHLENISENTHACQAKCSWNCRETKYSISVRDSAWPQLSKVSVNHFLDRYVRSKSDSTFYKMYLDGLQLEYNRRGEFNDSRIDHNKTYTYEDVFEFLRKYAVAGNFTEPPDVESVTKNKTMVPMLNPELLGLESEETAEIRWIRSSFYRLNVYFAGLYRMFTCTLMFLL